MEPGGAEATVISGARKGKPTALLRLLARAVPPRLATFVLPGNDIARAAGLELEAAGLILVTTPRHATLLLVVGELPEALLNAAVVVYAQMPRPRVLIALGAKELSPLPRPDAGAAGTQEGLASAIEQARRLLREGAWSDEAEPFEADVLTPKRRKRKKPPPKQRKGAGGDGTENLKQGGPATGGQAEGAKAQGAHSHGGMDGGMGGGDMAGMQTGFMSMVRLTQHLPRSADGLPMERVQAPFGPFFPGLPSGLGLTLWLDGDTVAKVETVSELPSRGLEHGLRGDIEGLSERLARLDPLAPTTYRLLALRALDSLPTGEREGKADIGWVAAHELERAASHLNWLASFAYLLGDPWLSQTAARWHSEVRRCTHFDSIPGFEPRLLGFLQRIPSRPLLSQRLRGLGRLDRDELEGVTGPVARGSGLARDFRLGDPAYRSLAFEPVVRDDGDAMARLEVRLEEIERSLALVQRAGRVATADAAGGAPALTDVRTAVHDRGATSHMPTDRRGAEAIVETPRGTARLRVTAIKGKVEEAELDTPSALTVNLIERVAVGLELADALAATASLDISPWEAAR
jgi:Ni,Fe-hydrogenase III large subunit